MSAWSALNVAIAVWFLIGYAWRGGDHVQVGKTRSGQLALSAAAFGLLVLAVILGQTLTYRFGVRVDNRATSADRSVDRD